MQTFDYIILGAGCSGLSLLVRLIESGQCNDKKILLLDREQKTLNDRTWCFWESDEQAAADPIFSSLAFHSYDRLWLRHPGGDLDLDIDPYRYKMIRGIDFYNYCFQVINRAKNITVIYDEVSAIDSLKGVITAGNQEFGGEFIFSSVLLEAPQLGPDQYYLLQHFHGWWIETDTDFFNPGEADLMNFRTAQDHGCTFVYVLPVSKRRALIEYTLFTESVLEAAAYEEGLRTFIGHQLQLKNYHIRESEHGVIPMTNIRFPQAEGKVIFIGTAGGQTKPSTGYTFRFIQKQSAAIVDSLAHSKSPVVPGPASRYMFYDSVLLRVLHERKIPGADVFHRMFKKNKAARVLKFLDNDTNFLQELAIMNSSSKTVFLPAGIKEML